MPGLSPTAIVFAALTLAARPSFPQDVGSINPKLTHGVKGDGRVVVPQPRRGASAGVAGCATTAGSPTLTCPPQTFIQTDTGKVVVVYGAGKAMTDKNGKAIVQPFSSTIVRYVDAAHVDLAGAALTTTRSSERTVWGTDDTRALQDAVDALAARGGGTLEIPAGVYLTTGLSLPCGATGTFQFVGPCPRAYNNISIHGAGMRETALENWQVAGGTATLDAVISIGRNAKDNEYNDRNSLVRNLVISDLSVRQVAHASEPRFIIIGRASADVVVQRVHGTGWSYEGIITGGDSLRWQILDSEIDGCGWGGPASSGPGCLNPGSSMSRFARNTISNAGTCFETGGAQNVYEENRCSGQAAFDATGVNAYCFFIGSSGTGIYNLTFRRNTCVHADLNASNVLGTLNRIRITDNEFRDSFVSLASGLETSSVTLRCCPDTVVHGQSEISSNNFTFSREARVQNFPIRVIGVESVLVKDNRIVWQSAFGQQGADHGKPCARDADVPRAAFGCKVANAFLSVADYGGGAIWRPSHAYRAGAYVIPSDGSGVFYVATKDGTSGATTPAWPDAKNATVADGGTAWKHMGPLPRLEVDGNRVTIPPGIAGLGTEVSFFGGTNPATISIVNQVMSFPWKIQCANSEFVPRGCKGGNIGPIPPSRPYTFRYEAPAR